MTAAPPQVTKALAKQPAAIRKTLRTALAAQCGGNWDRVLVNPDGSFTVRNGAAASAPTRAAKAAPRATSPASPAPATAGQPTSGPTAAPTAPASPAPAPAATPAPATPQTRPAKAKRKAAPLAATPARGPALRGQCTYVKDDGNRCVIRVANPGDRCALHDGSAFGRKVEKTIEPGVRVVLTRSESLAASKAKPSDPAYRQEKWTPPEDANPVQDFDWEKVAVQPVAARLRTLFAKGYPENKTFTYYPDVLAMEGVDLEAVAAAVHHPDYVQVRPESVEKGYPILGFWRGDVLAVMGMKLPTSPQCIAAYFLSHTVHDTHRVNHTGGGGTRKVAGLPRSPRQSIGVLRALGANVHWDELDPAQHAAEVTYQGECLGKVTVGAGTRRDQVEHDYQRTLRKMQAINRRLAATG